MQMEDMRKSNKAQHKLGFPGGTCVKEPAGHIKDMDLIPGTGKTPGEGHGNSLQYSCLENPMDNGAWRATVRRVTQSWTLLKQRNTHTHSINCSTD